ncbi:MAG TPA: AI-2E family transporter [Candidatus Limnocylindria bacterium]|nr:AI-2E family transporter [Candidatus Limnocylindria bacterium]
MNTPRTPLATWWVTRVLVAAAMVVAVILALQLIFAALSGLAHVIVLVVFGVIMAFVLAPLVDRLAPRIGRSLAVVFTALVALVVLVGSLAALAVPLVRETAELAREVPRMVEFVSSNETINIAGIEISGDVRQRIGTEIGARLGDWSQQAARGALRVGAGILDVLVVFVLGIYFLASAPRVRRWVDSMIPTRQRAEFRRIELDAARLFGRYIRGQLLLGVIIGTVSAIAYLILGVPYAVFLGVLAGVLELVPIAGPIVAGAVAAVVSLTEPFPLVVWVVLAATAIQQLENHILVPRIAGTAVGLHPLAALLAVLVGVEVAGVVGALFAVPLTGLAWSIYRARVDPEAAKA